jgi:hypothetical protein
VQKPLLAFQQAKLAFERRLIDSGLTYSIVRPTAFFKSLSGQVERVKRGRPFLVFGDGTLTACKPISDGDLADYLADCLDDPQRHNRILPIGGPGPAITPRQQGEHLFALLGRAPQIRQVPLGLLDGIIGALSLAGRVLPALAAKAELARIGRYYATESMLVLDPVRGTYDADATPSTGSETLFDLYARLVRGEAAPDRGDGRRLRGQHAGGVCVRRAAVARSLCRRIARRLPLLILWRCDVADASLSSQLRFRGTRKGRPQALRPVPGNGSKLEPRNLIPWDRSPSSFRRRRLPRELRSPQSCARAHRC